MWRGEWRYKADESQVSNASHIPVMSYSRHVGMRELSALASRQRRRGSA